VSFTPAGTMVCNKELSATAAMESTPDTSNGASGPGAFGKWLTSLTRSPRKASNARRRPVRWVDRRSRLKGLSSSVAGSAPTSANRRRSSVCRTLPAGLRGSSSRKKMCPGTLNAARWVRTWLQIDQAHFRACASHDAGGHRLLRNRIPAILSRRNPGPPDAPRARALLPRDTPSSRPP